MSDDRIAGRDEVYAWYRGDRCYKNEWGRMITPASPEWTRNFGYHKKREIKRGVEMLSGMRGPFMRDMQAYWLNRCHHLRHILTTVEMEVEERIKSMDQHRRLIRAHRQMRFSSASQRDATSPFPFYVEPNTGFVPEEDISVAEKHGIAFQRSIIEITSARFHKLNRIMQTSRAARRARTIAMTGLWSSKYDMDDAAEIPILKEQKVRCMFLFSDSEVADRFDEHLVWLLLKS